MVGEAQTYAGECFRCREPLWINSAGDGLADTRGEQLCHPERGTGPDSMRHEVTRKQSAHSGRKSDD